jgi:predicted double-glycine peptidase
MPRCAISRICGFRRIPIALALASAVALVPDGAGWSDDRPVRGQKDVRSLLELRRDKVVLQEYDISCGAAALATILVYQHGDAVAEETIAKSMLQHTAVDTVRARLGFSLLDLKRYAERRGYAADGYAEVTLADLRQMGPAIVRVHINVYDHFVVFRGLQDDRVLLADPAFGNRTMRIDEFVAAWRDQVAFFVSRPDGQSSPDRLSSKPRDFIVPSKQAIRAALG